MSLARRGGIRLRQVSAVFEGKVDARRPTDSKSTGPFDDRLRAHHAGGMEEVDVARPAESVAEVDRTVSDPPLRIDETTKAVGPVEIPAAVITHVGVDPPALEEGDGGEDFEDRSGRKGHLDRPVKQRMPRIVGEPLPCLCVGNCRGAEIEPRRAGGDEHGAALHIQGHDAASRGATRVVVVGRALGFPRKNHVEEMLHLPLDGRIQRQLDIAAGRGARIISSRTISPYRLRTSLRRPRNPRRQESYDASTPVRPIRSPDR